MQQTELTSKQRRSTSVDARAYPTAVRRIADNLWEDIECQAAAVGSVRRREPVRYARANSAASYPPGTRPLPVNSMDVLVLERVAGPQAHAGIVKPPSIATIPWWQSATELPGILHVCQDAPAGLAETGIVAWNARGFGLNRCTELVHQLHANRADIAVVPEPYAASDDTLAHLRAGGYSFTTSAFSTEGRARRGGVAVVVHQCVEMKHAPRPPPEPPPGSPTRPVGLFVLEADLPTCGA